MIDRHPNGTFSWAEIVAPDATVSTKFYSRLLEWNVHADNAYTMYKTRGKTVCAAYAAPEPARWLAYVTVNDLDRTCQRAAELGARVTEAPRDVLTLGRTATIVDPTGAELHLWQAKTMIGAELLREHGALTWFELATRDLNAAEKFYSSLFEWTIVRRKVGATTMALCALGDQPVCALLNMDEPWGLAPIWKEREAHWYCYFQVPSAAATAANVQGLGGKVLVAAQAIPGVGHFAMVQDLSGAIFGLMS